jgi:hypothetical protein
MVDLDARRGVEGCTILIVLVDEFGKFVKEDPGPGVEWGEDVDNVDDTDRERP